VAGGLTSRPCRSCRTDRRRLIFAGAVSLGLHLLVLTLPAPADGDSPARETRRRLPGLSVTLSPSPEPDLRREASRTSDPAPGTPAGAVPQPEPAELRETAGAGETAPESLPEEVPEAVAAPVQEALPESLPVSPPYSLPGPSPAADSPEAFGGNPLPGAAEVSRPAPPASGNPPPELSGPAERPTSGAAASGTAEVPEFSESADPPGTVSFSSLVPRRTLPLPPYPEAARRLGYQGRVTLEFTVTPEGRVENIRTVEREAPEILVEGCLRTVRRWRFRPSGEAALTRKTFVFLLEN